MQFTLRDYRPADFRTLFRIDQSCFPPGIAYTPFELKAYVHRWGSFTLVAEAETPAGTQSTAKASVASIEEDPRILGFLVAERHRRSGHIITIDVRSEARRYRIGSALLETAESRLQRLDCRIVRLETAVDNVAALAFYKRHKYTVVKTIPRYYSSGVDALLLEKDLLSPLSSR